MILRPFVVGNHETCKLTACRLISCRYLGWILPFAVVNGGISSCRQPILQRLCDLEKVFLNVCDCFSHVTGALRNYEDAPNTVVSRWLVSAKIVWYLHS